MSYWPPPWLRRKPQGRQALENALAAIRDKAPTLGAEWASEKARKCLEWWGERP